jgi:DNA mismatch repair protein MutL
MDQRSRERREIRVLPDDVVDQIAAGEVIERPASVVKELVENAFDAGATHVNIEIDQGGRRLIRVLDNGVGMSEGEVRLALTRHATSKLRTLDDLFTLDTMGFRGEALPSIASVSRMSIITRTRDQVAGTQLEIEAGKVLRVSEVGAPVGTQIEVRDLLFNVPARLKFLKGQATEAAHITDAVSKLAMVHAGVHIRLRHGGRVALDAPQHTSGLERARSILGARLGRTLHAAVGSENGVRVEAYLAGPDLAQTTTRSTYMFVGRRTVKDRGLLQALAMGYGELIPRGRFPVAILRVDVPGSEVDVNVHPQKLEVRFSDAQLVYAAVRHVVRRGVAEAPWLAEEQTGSPVRMRATAHATPPPGGPGQASRMATSHAAETTRMLLPFGRAAAPAPGPREPRVQRAEAAEAPPAPGQPAAPARPVATDAPARPVATDAPARPISLHAPAARPGTPPTGVPRREPAAPAMPAFRERDDLAARDERDDLAARDERDDLAERDERDDLAERDDAPAGAPGRSAERADEEGAGRSMARTAFPLAPRDWQAITQEKRSSRAAEAAPWPYARSRAGAASKPRTPDAAAASAPEPRTAADWARLAEIATRGASVAPPAQPASAPAGSPAPVADAADAAQFFTRLRYIGQLDRTYLVCEAGGEMVLVDQHAAHERVAFQRLRDRYEQRAVPVQRLLFPKTLELAPAQAAIAEDLRPTLSDMGFELEPFGGQTYALKSVPAGLREGDVDDVLTELLDELAERGGSRALEERLDLALATIACHSAVRAGDLLSDQEVHALFQSLDAVDFKAHCPHGRPVLLRIRVDEIARRFGR